MILIDTSIWIDFFRNNNPTLSNKVVQLLENRNVIGISCVFGELLQGTRTEEEQHLILEFWNNISKVDEENLFIEAGILSNRNKLFAKGVGIIDCYILAAAKRYDLEIWTLDKKLFEMYEIMK